ncbi:MAG TPA: S8 family serine peptidase, partial [Thermoanaerobaculia bacterium]
DNGTSAVPSVIEQLRVSPDVELVADVFHYRKSGQLLAPTDEIVVKLKANMSREALDLLAAAHGLRFDRTLWRTPDEVVLRALNPKTTDILAKARALHDTHLLQWAEPNFVRAYKKQSTPNDPLFSQQWHLNNTGQGGGTAGADVKAPGAWDTQTGSSAITIAIVDDGVQKAHEDLAANIFTNPGEIPLNGIDDDANGYIDDVNGWDFYANDNNADPSSGDENHGTAVAGVAAARGNNSVGVSGACRECKLLPVKIFSSDFAGDTAAANALRYAASFADVVNNSWGGGAPSATLQSAIATGRTEGRAGKGSAMMFASGNDSSGYFLIYADTLPAGTHRFRWTYSKDESFNDGEDSAWVAWVMFPGGELVNFEGGSLPSGFTTGGNASWSVVNDPLHADEGRCYTRAAKAGVITHDQSSYLQAVKTLPAGDFYTYVWVSGEEGYDGLTLDVDLTNNGDDDLTTELIAFVPYIDPGVSYPAAHPESIAVGASTNFDCRSYYSQVGPELAFVAPSDGSPLNLGIQTTDRTGGSGYDLSNYASDFGGTSAAAPLASGVVGLLLSRNPSLTVPQLLTAMQSTATKVGPQAYVSGRNDRYGYGRLNAQAALLSIGACASVSVSPSVLPNAAQNSLYLLSFLASGGALPYTYSVPIGALPPGMSLSPLGLLSGTPTSQGTFSFTVQAVDANGCMGYRAINLVVGAPVVPVTGTSLYLVTPCRIMDTRNPVGAYGGPSLLNNATRVVQMTGVCGIPSTAKAIAANVTVVGPTTTGLLAFFPSDAVWPGNSTINYRANKTRANNTIIRLSAAGLASVYNIGATQHFIVDVTGYFQ